MGVRQPENVRLRLAMPVAVLIACGAIALAPTSSQLAEPLPSAPPVIGGCNVFPADNIWNVPVDTLPVDASSNAYISSIGSGTGVHPDFGTVWEGAPIGIPFVLVPGTQPKVTIHYTAYGDESDPGPFPVPSDAPIEGGTGSDGDRHVLVVDTDHCMLYELYRAFPQGDGSWNADSGAKYNLSSHTLRPAGWTSADAAGLPIFPGLVRYDEVAAGEVRHAVRFTAPQTRRAYVWPARHFASSSTNPALPPMGQRFRLKASFDISGFSPQVQVILQGLKKYGMVLADNGAAWYISGAPDSRWNDDMLVNELCDVHGHDFEAVDVSSLMIDPNSGQARTGGGTDRRLDVTVTGNGSVTSIPQGIDCPGDCSDDFPTNTPVTLTAAPAAGWKLDHWDGSCDGSSLSCQITMDSNRSVTAAFAPLPGTDWLRVVKPNGGESWRLKKQRTIRWTSNGFQGNVKIDLSTDGGASWKKAIASSTPNDGSHSWKVSGKKTTRARVRIMKAGDAPVSDMSDRDFTIR